MKVTILSDLHLDFYIKPASKYKEAKIRAVFDKRFNEDRGEVLIIAGDISHYNSQTLTIPKMLAEIYGFKKVFCVLGNHDYYLLTSNYWHRYKGKSINRIQEIWDYKDPDDIVHFLNGDVVEYKGYKFGGANSFYDATYLQQLQRGMYHRMPNPIDLWKATMNDNANIKGYVSFYDIWAEEKPKIEKLMDEDLDVMITHVAPLSEHLSFEPHYKYLESSAFYAFDGEDYLDKTTAKLWVYGHSHGFNEFDVYDVKVINNSMGYPGEGQTIRHVTIDLDEL